MGNSNGITSGREIIRICKTCNNEYQSWSDDTMTIKGPMRPRLECKECIKKYVESEEYQEMLKKSFEQLKLK